MLATLRMSAPLAVTNRAQRVALKRVFDRTPVYINGLGELTSQETNGDVINYGPLTYRQFRKRVVPAHDCIMLRWCGMWLGIEKDGYTHS